MAIATISLKERFESKFTPEPMSGCWLWTAALDRNGYGILRVNGETVGAHRISWTLYYAEPADGVHILHKCDTPCCVNPEHLFAGSHADNMRDKERKNRGNHAYGSANGFAKLTAEQVKKIRADTRSAPQAAPDYGVSPSNIVYIRAKRSWKHVT